MAISKAKTFSNVLYTCLTKGATLVCLFVTSSVIARNLTPAEYGVVGFANIIIGFLIHFGDMGVGNAVIRSGQINERKLSTAFTLKIVLGTGALVAAFAIAPFAHHFLDHPQVGNVIRLLSLNFLISTIGFLSMVTLMREMNYRALAIPGVVGAIIRCVLVVGLIMHGWKYWAIIAADIGATFVTGVITQLVRRVPMRLSFNWSDAREYLRFGIPLFGTGVLVFLIFNLDNFLVGAKLGSTELGYYAIAFTWASFICTLLYDTVNNVLFPTFSAMQDDTAAMRRWYLKTLDLVVFVAVVANTALLVNAHVFVVTFLGKGTDKWVPATLTLQILCVYGVIRAATEPVAPCLMARGHTNLLWRANLLAGSIELPALLLALSTRRIEWIAGVVLVAYASQAIIYLPHLRREFSIGLGDLAEQLWPAVPAIAAGFLATSILPSSFGSSLFTLAVRGMFTAAVVGLTHGICTRFRCFHEASGMISQKLAQAAG